MASRVCCWPMRWHVESQVLSVPLSLHLCLCLCLSVSPSLTLSLVLSRRVAGGQLTWEQYGGVHPAPAGNAIAAQLCEELLSAAWQRESMVISLSVYVCLCLRVFFYLCLFASPPPSLSLSLTLSLSHSLNLSLSLSLSLSRSLARCLPLFSLRAC
eukprot:COSAG03_NODE_3838_length_1804_cov_8.914956_2_plen_156_part_00